MNSDRLEFAPGVSARPTAEGILTAESVEFLGELAIRFAPRVEQLLRLSPLTCRTAASRSPARPIAR
jgi:malate synthase